MAEMSELGKFDFYNFEHPELPYDNTTEYANYRLIDTHMHNMNS